MRENKNKTNSTNTKIKKNNDNMILKNNGSNNKQNSSKNSTNDNSKKGKSNCYKSSNNINVYNIGVKNVYVDNKSVNIYSGNNINKEIQENISYSRKSSANTPNNNYCNRQKHKKTSNRIQSVNIDKNKNIGYKITSDEQNQSFKFNSPAIVRKDIFGSVIEKHGKQKISFADNPLIKPMNKSRSCPDIKGDNNKNNNNKNEGKEGENIDQNSKLYDPFAEVILIQSYKALNKKNVYGDKPRTRTTVAKDTELICCGTYCNIF